MRDLNKLIADAYRLFAPYTLGPTLSVCKACCITDADEQMLLVTPLSETSSDMLFRGYYESAHYHSERENWEMKHFLPRVLELVSAFDFPCHSTEITFMRLDLDQPAYWLPAERELLDEFALAFFDRCLGHYPLPSGDALADVLLMFGLAHFDLRPLLRAWVETNTPTSLSHLSRLLLDDLELAPNSPPKLSNPFSKPYVDTQVAAWLGAPAVRATLATQLESAILHDQLPDELASQASWAYEVLTLGLA